jgi:hypothetical protein
VATLENEGCKLALVRNIKNFPAEGLIGKGETYVAKITANSQYAIEPWVRLTTSPAVNYIS